VPVFKLSLLPNFPAFKLSCRQLVPLATPGFLQLFTFRDQAPATFYLSAQVRLHAGVFVATLTKIIDQLSDVEELKTTCGSLGQRHKKYKMKKGHLKVGLCKLNAVEGELTA
jgi:hypothetical protein